MTTNYRDYTTYVSTHSLAGEYSSVAQTYTSSGFQFSVPNNSLLKLQTAPGTEKYFSAAPQFQSRSDNFRIPPPAKTGINLGSSSDSNGSSTVSEVVAVNGGDYFTLGESYKLNPQ